MNICVKVIINTKKNMKVRIKYHHKGKNYINNTKNKFKIFKNNFILKSKE